MRVRSDQRVKHRLELQFGFGELPHCRRAITNAGTRIKPGGMSLNEAGANPDPKFTTPRAF